MAEKLEWSTAHEKKYEWLYGYLKTQKENDVINRSTYINVYLKELFKIIDSNPKWAQSAKEGLLFMVARWLSIHKPKSKYIKLFQEEAYKIKQAIDKEESHNKVSEKYKDSYKDLSFYHKILEPKTHQIDHYKTLLLALLTKQPPVRTSFYTSAKLITSVSDDDSKSNFVLITPEKVQYIINTDKISKTKNQVTNPELKFIDVDNDSLVRMIRSSIILYPRTYLFDRASKPYTQNTLITWLREKTGVKNINIDIMRSTYITKHHKDNISLHEKDVLARKMRHTTHTASKNYNKILDV
jgi:hypothetical protein